MAARNRNKSAAEPVEDAQVEGAPATEAPKDEETTDDSVFNRTFVVSLKGIAGGAGTLTDEAFHNANKVATLQDAINAGFRATGDVSVASEDAEGEGSRASLRVTYSVPVVKASEDDRHPSEVPNPRETIIDMGGSTTGDNGDQPA